MTASPLWELFSTKFSPNPAEQQQDLTQRFKTLISQTNFSFWQPGESFPLGTLILVGVMIGWNTYDQELIASLDDAIANGLTGSDLIAVIVADELTTPESIESIFPNLGGAKQSPFLGHWENGQLRAVDSGPSAMALISNRYGLKLL
jgi:hypothetical protein